MRPFPENGQAVQAAEEIDPALTSALEARLVNAWPSTSYHVYDGWLLRLAGGYSKRANAAAPLVAGANLDAPLIDHMLARFQAAGVRPTFRLTGLEHPDTDRLLAERGFALIEPTTTLVAAIDPGLTLPPDLEITSAATPEWVSEAAAAYGGEKADSRLLMQIVSRIAEPAAFAILRRDGLPAAFGLAVAERGFVGLYDIVVAPERRGQGLGRRLVEGLVAWGRTKGAATAYLQVREENAPALALYRGLGFRLAYCYRHRVMA